MPTFTLEIFALGDFLTDTPTLEVFADGILDSSTSISSTGTLISSTISFSGTIPSSLEFRFNDALPEIGRSIEIRSVSINNKFVNIGNFLSTDTLTVGTTATVAVPAAAFIFDPTEPTPADFLPATRTFTVGSDRYRNFNGTTDETFDLLAGNDSAYLGSGNDTVNGNDGNDLIRGGAGDDLLYGALGNDRLFGQDGDDTLYGGEGNDRLFGNEGADELYGGNGNDNITGHNGDDILVGGAGTDVLSGGSGTDFLFGDEGADQLVGGNGNDTLDGGDGDDIVLSGNGNDTADGGAGDDIIAGDAGNDILNGGAGNDTIFGDNRIIVIGQAGQVTTDQTSSTQWHSITFDAAISNPVLKLSFNTTNDDDPATLRVRNVTDTGFEWQIDEYEYLDGVHGTETISWIAVAAGTHTLDDGTVIQAGQTTATNNDFTDVTFNSAFTGAAPVITTQISTVNEGTAAVLHNENRTLSGFRVQIEEQEINGTAHATETIDWIAISNGGTVADGFLVGETGNSVTAATTTVNFGAAFPASNPVIIIDQQTEDGGDTAISRGQGSTSSSIAFNIDEEQSREAEVNHTTEVVGYYALTAGVLYGDTLDGDDIINGGAGLDTLYGGDGADTFLFESLSAFSETDEIKDFRYYQNDVLDISDLISDTVVTITDYVQFVDNGTDTLVQVDTDGLGVSESFQTIASLDGVTGLDEAALFANGNIVV